MVGCVTLGTRDLARRRSFTMPAAGEGRPMMELAIHRLGKARWRGRHRIDHALRRQAGHRRRRHGRTRGPGQAQVDRIYKLALSLGTMRRPRVRGDGSRPFATGRHKLNAFVMG
jgi:hypothetical protein